MGTGTETENDNFLKFKDGFGVGTSTSMQIGMGNDEAFVHHSHAPQGIVTLTGPCRFSTKL